MAIDALPLVAQYGYAATFIGTLVEGETVLVLSGIAAARSVLAPPLVIALGTVAAFTTDNFFFGVGRALGPALFVHFPRFAVSTHLAGELVARLPNTAVIGLRFFYGMRSVGPAIIGSGYMSWARFAVLDALAATLWSTCWTSAGFLLGETAEALMERYGPFGRMICISLLAATAIALLARHLIRRRALARLNAEVRAPKA